MSYTKGPWTAHYSGDIESSYVYGPSGLTVAKIGLAERKHGQPYGATLPEEHANARLIAAAPLLLEALKEFIDYYEAYNPITDKRIEPYAKLARHAIAAAEGQEVKP